MTTSEYERGPRVTAEKPALTERLDHIWETAPGFYGWLATVDHKKIGIRYIVTAFAFLVAGGIEALIFRLQLAWSNLHLLTPEQYDQMFTMHGMTMIFLYAGPILSGFSNYLWPLLINSRPAMMTAPVALGTLIGLTKVSWGGIMAGATMLTAPILIIFVLLQRHFIAGIAAGAIK